MDPMRFARYLSVLVLLVAVVVAPAAPAVAATPAVTIDDASYGVGPEIVVSGTFTCSQPTGQARVQYWASNWHPLETAFGVGETRVPCANGPVPWSAAARPGFIGFDDAFPLSVIATLYRDGVQEATTLNFFQPGWAD
jgi:hypothetical protein